LKRSPERNYNNNNNNNIIIIKQKLKAQTNRKKTSQMCRTHAATVLRNGVQTYETAMASAVF